MSVRAAKRHIMSDMKLEQFIYRIFLLSPFEILQNQQLASTWRIKVYMFLILVLYYTFRISFCLTFQDINAIIEHFSYNGKLWMFVDMFDFTFSALSFGIIVLNGLITKTQQIEFFEKLHHFDERLLTSFGIPIRRSRTRAANSCSLIVGLAYFLGYFLSLLTDTKYEILTAY